MRFTKAFLAVAIFIYVVVALFMVGPVYFHYLGFKDAIEDESRTAAFSNRTEQNIREEISKKIAENSVPIKVDDMVVSKQGNAVVISGDYVEHVDLPLHPIDLHFHVGSDNAGSLIK